MPADFEKLLPADRFVRRHVGPDDAEIAEMVRSLGMKGLDELVDATVPKAIRMRRPLDLPPAATETDALAELREKASRNRPHRSLLGMGYHDTVLPAVIQRNVLENPGWYTQYTPYQAEISQGRLEALVNFQTMIVDLTGLPVANASLLDEATAAAEAMSLMHRVAGTGRDLFLVSSSCHPQVIDVVATRAAPLGLRVVIGDPGGFQFGGDVFGALVQYPTTDGAVEDYRDLCRRAHEGGALVAMAADLLALALLVPPGELGADVAVGSTQRFGVPLGYGGPHAAYFATRDDLKRQVPGRIIGWSHDAQGRPALRMALATREQHIRREKATSNICTAQVLLAVIAGMYGVYHGPAGLRAIAERIHLLARVLAKGLRRQGHALAHEDFFDTLRVEPSGRSRDEVLREALARGLNLRAVGATAVGVALDEKTTPAEVEAVLACFGGGRMKVADLVTEEEPGYRGPLARTSAYLEHPVFNSHHSETKMLRYIRKLESRDLSLTTSMIPLGSCTMKLNATSEMLPVTWPEIGSLHPFAPVDQAQGYAEIFADLSAWLAEMSGLPAVSLQPNSGASGEYAGLLVIREHHRSRGEAHRDVCLIPSSAHGTNPASAAMAGMQVVVVACDERGNIDLGDLRKKAAAHAGRLAAAMVTYPSTHGVFEEGIKDLCAIVHEHGGQVYMDGANLNAQVGLCRPGDMGADVIHVNLHKTFCIPHGGGGPGMGPICVARHLAPFLPGHPVVKTGGSEAIGAVSAAPWGSASILVISWMYCRMMGGDGLTHATKVAILNANYMARRLGPHFPVLYSGTNGTVAHECILDARELEKTADVKVEDIAKRLMDYGFHAPTVSFPVAGTLMIEPTESEGKDELDRLVEALVAIRREIDEIATGKADRKNNVLKNAPHPPHVVTATEWPYPYPRERAAYPAPWTRQHKFWPVVSRIDGAAGDRNLACTCLPMEAYQA